MDTNWQLGLKESVLWRCSPTDRYFVSPSVFFKINKENFQWLDELSFPYSSVGHSYL